MASAQFEMNSDSHHRLAPMTPHGRRAGRDIKKYREASAERSGRGAGSMTIFFLITTSALRAAPPVTTIRVSVVYQFEFERSTQGNSPPGTGGVARSAGVVDKSKKFLPGFLSAEEIKTTW
jgi:hypothetical protein